MRRAARRLAESVGVIARLHATRQCASHRTTPAWTPSCSAGPPRTAPTSDLPIFSSPFAVARRARAYASLRKEVTRDGSVRWVRLAGSGEGDRGDADGTTADDRRERRSRPSRPNRTRTPTDPETNRQRALNTRVSTAPDAVSALREFAEAHRAFPNGVNDVNVAALFVVLARSNRLCSLRGTSAARLESLEGSQTTKPSNPPPKNPPSLSLEPSSPISSYA